MGCGERVRSRALGQTIRGNRSVSQLLEISLIGIQYCGCTEVIWGSLRETERILIKIERKPITQ
jgi:hypothetical protein